MSEVEVRRVEDARRYEAYLDGERVGLADYRERGDGVVVLPHTEVARSVGGRGIGGRLVQGTLDDLRGRGKTVVPSCSFVADWIDRHPDYADLLA